MGTWGDAYLARLRACAAETERDFVDISARDRSVRLVEDDAQTVEEGFEDELWGLGPASDVRTLDPEQDAAWLVEGDPARPRWESLPHLAGYVELLRAGYPESGVRFATPEDELGLDLAAVSERGEVLLLGAVRAEPLELTKLEALVPTFEGDRSFAAPRVRADRDALRLAVQLWATRSPYLWLVAAGARRLYRVAYGRTITLTRTKLLPMPQELWPHGAPAAVPRVAAGSAAAAR